MNSLSFLAHPCPVHVLLFSSKDSLTRRVPFFAPWLKHYNLLFIGLELTKAQLMPFKQLSRMLSHHRRQNLLHNRSNFQILRPSNLRFFYYFLVLLYLFVFVFSPMLARVPLYFCFLFSTYAFLLGFAFSLLASYIMSFTFCLVVCWFTRFINFSMPRHPQFFTHCSFYLFLHSPFVSFLSFWYILVCIFLCRFYVRFYFYRFCSLEIFNFGFTLGPACLFKFFFIFTG